MVSMVIDPINQSFCSFSVSDNGRILEGKNDWARWSYRHVTTRSDYLLRYATRMPRQHWCFAGLALQSEGLNFPVILVARHTIARYSSSYLYFLYLEIDTKLWVKKKKRYWKERERERNNESRHGNCVRSFSFLNNIRTEIEQILSSN